MNFSKIRSRARTAPKHKETAAHKSNRRLICSGLLVLIIFCLAFSQARAGSPRLRTYGFFDLEAEVGDKDNAARRWAFDQHHLTVVWLYELDSHFRVLFETSYEHGPSHSSDAAEGKIYLPKAYGEFVQSDAFKLRFGKFLPPFGIYNERHDATPTLIPTILPQSVYGKHTNLTGNFADSLGQSVRAYPRFATGIWALGTAFIDEWELEYQVYLVNGRGSNAHEKDMNNNKGVGGRLVITPPGGPHLGASYYNDRNCVVNDAQQDALEFDLGFEISNFFLETAVILPRYETLDSLAHPSGKMRKRMGYYLMAGCTFFEKTTPFAYFDYYDPDKDKNDDGERDVVFGINQMLSQNVFLKGEVHLYNFADDKKDSYKLYITSVAVAF